MYCLSRLSRRFLVVLFVAHRVCHAVENKKYARKEKLTVRTNVADTFTETKYQTNICFILSNAKKERHALKQTHESQRSMPNMKVDLMK